MTQLISVVSAVDFSPIAAQAAGRATRVATELGLPLRLVHVLETSLLDRLRRLSGAPLEGMRDQALQALRKLATDAQAQMQTGAIADVELREGSDKQQLVSLANPSTLLVIGARGHHGLREAFFGGCAHHLIYQGRGPVLVVRNSATQPYQRVLVATDFSENSRRALQRARALAPSAELHMVHVATTPLEGLVAVAGLGEAQAQEYRDKAVEEASMQLSWFVADNGLDETGVSSVVTAGYAPQRIRDIAKDIKADLIVVGKRGNSEILDMLVGGVTLHLLQAEGPDLLIEH